jgi:hypothetical protein
MRFQSSSSTELGAHLDDLIELAIVQHGLPNTDLALERGAEDMLDPWRRTLA